MDIHQGYFYGALLGDGHINYTSRALESANDPTNRRGPMLMLKVCDLDFIEKWRDSIAQITGFNYKISKHNPGVGSQARRQQYKLRVANRSLVEEAESLTQHKTIIPCEIFDSPLQTKREFVQGLMDAEAWINCYLTSIRQCDMTLGFACCDPWFEKFYELVQSMGVVTSKIYRRKAQLKKNGELGKTLQIFKLDIPSYINAGLSFSIKRKADRLAFCSRILNDYTRDYPRYEEYYRAEDIVWPAAKVAD